MPSKPRSLRYAEQAALQSLGLFYDSSKIKSIRNRSNTSFNPEECEAKMMSGLLPTQRDFVGDFENRYVLYVGGLGCMAAESLVEVWDGAKYVKTPIADLCSAPFFVKTLAGPALAFPAYRKGYTTLYRVELEDGRKFLATKDHQCLTPLGWGRVEQLGPEVEIAVDGAICKADSDYRSAPLDVFLQHHQVNTSFLAPFLRCFAPAAAWGRIEKIEAIRDDHYYDFHVPVLNHYIADGVVHHNSGKSYASVIKSILLAFRSPGKQHIYLEPTYGMINTVALPTWFKVLDAYNIPYTFRAAPPPKIYLHLPGGKTEIIMLPLLNYERLVGINAASAVVDEADTVKQEIAEAALIKLQGRVRVGGCPQICFASTPEGRKFIWSFFEKEKSDDKALYRADTRQNPHIDENYVLDLMQKYPPHLVEAYVKGEFVNLETATVFSEYDRVAHRSTVFHAENGEVILIGADFNIGKCSSVYAVMRRSPAGQILHVFDEHIARDTFSLAEHIKKKYAAHLMRNMVIIYPDSSGSHGSTSSTMSDHDILRECGAKVIAERRNPPIAETVAHANNCFHKKQLYINDSTCNDLVEVCDNWSYDSNLKPSKGGRTDYSHFGDALRYLVWQAIDRPGVGLGRGQRWR